jgi:hypothetical protein
LKDGYIRATQLSALNDPFEAIYCENALSELCLHFEIFQQKSDEWIYEKEHRVTLRLDQADKVIVNDIHRLKNTFVLNKLLKLGIATWSSGKLH